MSELVGEIFVTSDYARFKKLKGNRELRKNISLENSIKKSGIIIPIEVNEKFEILDGQNRFEIAKMLGISIPYRIINGLGIQEVIHLNSTTKPWIVMDFINKYCLDGNIEYIRLEELAKKYTKIPISSLASAAEGHLNMNSRTTQNVREGKSKLAIEYTLNKKDKPLIKTNRNTILLNTGGL